MIGIGNPAAMAIDPLMAHGFRIRDLETLVSHADAAGLGQAAVHEVGDSRVPAYLIALARS